MRRKFQLSWKERKGHTETMKTNNKKRHVALEQYKQMTLRAGGGRSKKGDQIQIINQGGFIEDCI